MARTNSELIYDQLVKGLDLLKDLVDRLDQKIQHNTISSEKIKWELSAVSEQLTQVRNLILTGNGQLSIISQIAVLNKDVEEIRHKIDNLNTSLTDYPKKHETDIENLEDDINIKIKEVSLELKKHQDAHLTQNNIQIAGKYTVIAGTIAGITSLIIVLIKWFLSIP